jgi:hypothetical protein
MGRRFVRLVMNCMHIKYVDEKDLQRRSRYGPPNENDKVWEG